MPKRENPTIIQLERDGGRAKLIQSEYELSPIEWHRRRTDAFSELRKTGLPSKLIELVENFEEETLVNVFVYRPTTGEIVFHVGVEVIGPQSEKDAALRGRRLTADNRESHNKKNNYKNYMTASEALALFLRLSLRNLRDAEKTVMAPPSGLEGMFLGA